ncbi:MAG: carbonic anhydrase [bacterium]
MSKVLLEGNKQFVQKVFGPENLAKLKDGQKPHTCWIGCSDSRVPSGLITGTMAGELFVHRNIANIVPPNDTAVGAVLEYAVEHLKVGQIVLCGHYGCGGMNALWKGPEKGTIVADWLKNGNAALRRVRAMEGIEKLSEAKALRLLVEENLRVQREHLLRYSFVRDAVKKERLLINVVVYDIATGKLKELKK